MLNRFGFILFCLSITTCMPIGRPRHYVTNDPRVIPYVRQWETITNRQQWTSISIVPLNDPDDEYTLGICWYTDDAYGQSIELNANYWNYLSDTDRLILVMHELGHCDLNYEHNNSPNLVGGCAYSIMNEYHIGEWCYNQHIQHYIEEYLYEE